MARIRTVKPSFFTDEELQDLERKNPGSYVMLVFCGLWGHCDKEGRFLWRPRLLKLGILPFLDFDMAVTLGVLQAAGYVSRYTVAGKEYGLVNTFGLHQRITGKESHSPAMYPSPSGDKPVNKPGNTCESHEDNQMVAQQTPPVDISGINRETPVKHPGAQERGKRKEERGMDSGALEPAAPAPVVLASPAFEPVQLAPVVIEIPLNTGELWPIREPLVQEWEKLFPAVDVRQALRTMRAWCDAKTNRRKTSRGVKAFVTGWLTRCQDKGECRRVGPDVPAAAIGVPPKPASDPRIKLAFAAWDSVKTDLKLKADKPAMTDEINPAALEAALTAVGGFETLKTLSERDRLPIGQQFLRVYAGALAKQGNEPLPSPAPAQS